MIANMVTDKEFELLLELLQAERNELGPEIHHTKSLHLKEELQDRLRSVDRLMERFRAMQAEQRSTME